MDLAVINQTFWNTAHGNFVSRSPGQGTILNGGHVFFIIFLLAPLYALFSSPLTLLFLQSLALALGAWPIYLLGKDLINRRFGFLFAFAYLIYPALNYVNLYEFHVLALATPLLIFMFYFYHKEQWRRFCLFLTLALFCREDVAIPVFAIGVFILVENLRRCKEKRREIKWALLPLCLAAIWFILCLKYIQPHFQPETLKSAGGANSGLVFFDWMGDSIPEAIINIFIHPVRFLSAVFIKPKRLYLLHLISPLAFTSGFSIPGLLGSAIALSEGLLSQRFTHYSIRYQYTAIITPLVFISAIYGTRNALRWNFLANRKWVPEIILLFFSLVSAYKIGPLFKITDGLQLWSVTEEDRARRKLLQEIEPGISVITTFEFAPQLSMRPELFFFYHVFSVSRHPDFRPNVTAAQAKTEYAIIDFDDWLTFYDFYTPDGDQAVYSFLREGNWDLAATVNSLALFRRGEKSAPGVVEIVPAGEGGEFRTVPGLPGLEAGPALAGRGKELGFDVLRFSADLRAARAPLPDILFVARLVNRSAPDQVIQQFLMAPYRIYPTHRWRAGETVRIRANILLPENLPFGNWDLQLLGLAKKPGLRLPPEAATAYYRHFDTAMALHYLPRIWGIPPDQLLDQRQVLYLPQVLSMP